MLPFHAGWQRGARLAPNWAREYWRAAFWTCATTPRCDARDRARLGIGHTIGRTSESLSLNLVEVPVCRGIWFLIGGTAKAFSCRRSHETLRKRSIDGGQLEVHRALSLSVCVSSLGGGHSILVRACLVLLVVIYQECVRPTSETGALVAGAAVSTVSRLVPE